MVVGFICPVTKKRVEFVDCLKCAAIGDNECDYTYSILNKIVPFQGVKYDDNKIWVTNLLSCLRKVYLDRTRKIYVYPKSLFYRFHGSLVHELLKRTKEQRLENHIIEEKFYREIEGASVVGKVDEIVLRGNHNPALLRDYKSTKQITIKNLPYANHLEECLLYRWLVFPQQINKIELVYMDYSRTYRWSQSYKKSGKFWSLQWLDEWMRKRVVFLREHLVKRIIPKRIFKDDDWRCSYCDYREICQELLTKLEGRL